MKVNPKYLKKVTLVDGDKIDIYAVLKAFDVHCPARQHGVKKLCFAGKRSKGTEREDLMEALQSNIRAIELLDGEPFSFDEKPIRFGGVEVKADPSERGNPFHGYEWSEKLESETHKEVKDIVGEKSIAFLWNTWVFHRNVTDEKDNCSESCGSQVFYEGESLMVSVCAKCCFVHNKKAGLPEAHYHELSEMVRRVEGVFQNRMKEIERSANHD